MKERIITGGMQVRGSFEEKEFNRKFWASVSPESKWAAAWGLAEDYCIFKGRKDELQSGLQRSVQNIKRK